MNQAAQLFTRHDRLDVIASLWMLLLCASWGLQQVAIKVAVTGVSPMLQAGLRSAIALICLQAWMWYRSIPVLQRDHTLGIGIVAGILFTLEFALFYWGITFTTASRAVVYMYTAPFFVAIGIHVLVPDERLGRVQVTGMLLAFTGIVLVFGEGITRFDGQEWLGDAMVLLAALLWGATTVLIRATKLSSIEPSRTLYYQLSFSAIAFLLLSWSIEPVAITRLTPLIIGAILFQGLFVAFITYLVWFWLIAQYPAARLSAFTFLTPLFGVIAGVVLLSEPATTGLLIALVLVGSGIYLVNNNKK